MNFLRFVLLACVFGFAGCAKNELDRSTALPLIENSPEFQKINFITSESVVSSALINIVRGGGMSNCGTDSTVGISKKNVPAMEQAEKYGLVTLDEIQQPMKNCTRTLKRATLTDKGQIANRGGEQTYKFRALTLRISQINGIKRDSDETSALVTFGVKVDERAENYRQLVSEKNLERAIESTYTALLGLYDDGWRVERLSRNR
jgi:hypothetical protein